MNVGSIFRIADALGVERIYLTGKTIRPPNRKIRKTSRSTENTVVYEEADDPIAVLVRLKNSGYKIICLEITNDSVDIRDAVFSSNDRICLVLGSENEGIPTELLAASDFAVHIPMFGVNSSMNVASACSIASFEITKGLMHG
jgi:tRNA G18 (ribose-2'-O)-methylase SpoU